MPVQLEMIATLRDQTAAVVKAMVSNAKALQREMDRLGGGPAAKNVRDQFREVDSSINSAARGLRDVFDPAFAAFGLRMLTVSGAVYAVGSSLNSLGKEGLGLSRLSAETRVSAENLKSMAEFGERHGVAAAQTYEQMRGFSRLVQDMTGGPGKTMVEQARQTMEFLRMSGPAGRQIADDFQRFVKANPGKTAEAFDTVMRDIGRLPAWEQIRILRDLKLPEIPDFAEKFAVFSKSFTADDIKRMTDYGNKIEDLGLKWTRFWQKSVIELAPLAGRALDWFDRAVSDHMSNMSKAGDDLLKDFKKVQDALDEMARQKKMPIEQRIEVQHGENLEKQRSTFEKLQSGTAGPEGARAIDVMPPRPREVPVQKVPAMPEQMRPLPEGAAPLAKPAFGAPRDDRAQPFAPPSGWMLDALRARPNDIFVPQAQPNIPVGPQPQPRAQNDTPVGPSQLRAPPPAPIQMPAPVITLPRIEPPAVNLPKLDVPTSVQSFKPVAAPTFPGQENRRDDQKPIVPPDWNRSLDKALKNQTGFRVQGDAAINVSFKNAPKGTDVEASAGGMFRINQINKSVQMGFADYIGEAYPTLDLPAEWGRRQT